MIDARADARPAARRRETVARTAAAARDDESRWPPRCDDAGDDAPAARGAIAARRREPTPAVAASPREIVRSVEARLPGRIRDLEVRVEDDQFVLSACRARTTSSKSPSTWR